MDSLQMTGFLRLPQVLKLIPVSKAKWYLGIASGEFPAPIKLGPRASAWRAKDIQTLIERLGQSSEPAV
jgi:predicted DNA-binding transcriptional regulator AlpA